MVLKVSSEALVFKDLQVPLANKANKDQLVVEVQRVFLVKKDRLVFQVPVVLAAKKENSVMLVKMGQEERQENPVSKERLDVLE